MLLAVDNIIPHTVSPTLPSRPSPLSPSSLSPSFSAIAMCTVTGSRKREMVNERMNCKDIAQEQLLPQQVTVMALSPASSCVTWLCSKKFVQF